MRKYTLDFLTDEVHDLFRGFSFGMAVGIDRLRFGAFRVGIHPGRN
jgi:hypothetical protein